MSISLCRSRYCVVLHSELPWWWKTIQTVFDQILQKPITALPAECGKLFRDEMPYCCLHVCATVVLYLLACTVANNSYHLAHTTTSTDIAQLGRTEPVQFGVTTVAVCFGMFQLFDSTFS